MPINVSNCKALDTYYATLATYRDKDVTHEQATRLAFSTLLDTLSKGVGWTLVLEQTLANRKRPDGTLYDDVKFPRGIGKPIAFNNESSVHLLTKLGLKRINQGEFVLSREEWQALVQG